MGQIAKTLNDYRRLPYTLRTEPATEGNYWLAEYIELRGCKTDGDTEADAVANLQELFDEYIQALIDENVDIPEPVKNFNAVWPIWIVVPLGSLSPLSDVEDAKGTQTSWDAQRFQVGRRETSIAYSE